MVVDNYYGSKFKVVFWVPWWAIYRAGSYLASEVVLVEFTKPKRHGIGDSLIKYVSILLFLKVLRKSN